jgi:hypothetical protein
VEEVLTWFFSFPRYLQLFVLVALATPLLVLHRYLNPPPPPRRPDAYAVRPDGSHTDPYSHR